MYYLRIILLPFVAIYFFLIRIRNWFFDKNVFKSKRADAKVISVGNITTGGSGKTPLVIFLTNLLKNEKKNVGVLSRGYRRRSSGYKLVSDGKKILTSVNDAGDEIFYTVNECKIPAAVSEKRYEGAVRLVNETGIKVIVLDDGFQHRWLHRDVNILIFEQKFLSEPAFPNHVLLPTGNLREPFDSVKRSDVVIINRKFSEKAEIPEKLKRYFEKKKIFTAFYETTGFVDMKRKTEYKVEEFKEQKSLVVAGIAKPYSFLNILNRMEVDTVNKILFIGHKDYSLKDIQKIRKEFYVTNSHSVVTTQKDAVKLIEYSRELDDIDIFYLKIELKLDEEKKFKEFILNNLN